MDLFEAITRRASVREFAPAPVSAADLEKILEAARRAPSGGNRQPLNFITIRSPETLKALVQVQPCFASASAAIGIIADPGLSRWWLEDASAAAESMLLAMTALGFSSVWVEGTLLKQEDYAKGLLGIPKEKRFVILLPIGKAPRDIPQADKKALADLVWSEKYGRK